MKVLMCPPTHFSIRYEINPWMKLKYPVQRSNAQTQWEDLSNHLRRLGVDVQTVPQKRGFPDMVFTANAGIVKAPLLASPPSPLPPGPPTPRPLALKATAVNSPTS